jgi:hypothetical protein
MGSIGARGHLDTRLLKQVIYCELHQDLIPQMRAVHPVGGERLFGQRGAKFGQAPSSLLLLTLAATQRIDLRLRPSLRLFDLSTPFPRGETSG